MGKLQKRKYDKKRRHIAEIIRYNGKRNFHNSIFNNKSKEIFDDLLKKGKGKKIRTKLEELLSGKYVSLNNKEKFLLRNKNFLNSQNYITSEIKNFKIFYYSKEKIEYYKKSKIMIDKIEKDIFEKFYINFLGLIWKNKKKSRYKIYLGKKFLYLVK